MDEQFFGFIFKFLTQEFLEDSPMHNDNFHLGILSGRISLNNLKIKPSAIEKLINTNLSNPKFRIKTLSIGHLQIDIPWLQLGSSKFSVTIDDIYIYLHPAYEEINSYDCQEDSEQQLTKQLKLSKYKLLSTSNQKNKNANDRIPQTDDNSKNIKKDGKNNDSNSNIYMKYILNYIKKSLNNILDTFEINITNVHIRYEDPVSLSLYIDKKTNKRNVYCLGFLMSSLTIISPELIDYQYEYDVTASDVAATSSKTSSSNINQTNNNISTTTIHIEKLIELRHLCIYNYTTTSSSSSMSSSCVTNLLLSKNEKLSTYDASNLISDWLQDALFLPLREMSSNYILSPTDINLTIGLDYNDKQLKVSINYMND